METSSEISTETTTVVSSPESNTNLTTTEKSIPHVEIVNRGSSFIGKVLKVIEQDADFVLAEIKVGEKYVEHLFYKSETTPVNPS